MKLIMKLIILVPLLLIQNVWAACPTDISGNYSIKLIQYRISTTTPPVLTDLALGIGSYKFTKSSTNTSYTGRSGKVNVFGFDAAISGGVGSDSGNGSQKYYFFDKTTCTGRVSDYSTMPPDYLGNNAYDSFFTVENSGLTIHMVTKSSPTADPQYTPNTILLIDLTKQ